MESVEEIKQLSRKKQWVFIRKVIKRDANNVGNVYNVATGKFCVIGGLAYALGWEPREDDEQAYTIVRKIPVIGSKFRVESLWGTNDKYDVTLRRRAALLRLTKRWEAEDAKKVRA